MTTESGARDVGAPTKMAQRRLGFVLRAAVEARMRIPRCAFLILPGLLSIACDSTVEAVAETPAPTPASAPASAAAPVQSSYVAIGRVDLQAVVDGVAQGSIDGASALEAKLASETVANVDLDADGVRDELRVVERRKERATVFEIRALPSAEVAGHAHATVDVEIAPVVALLELEAHADLGNAVARASFSPAFVASAKLEANPVVEHTFTGVSVSVDGLMHVDADANAFVAWTFQPRRPVFVAEVFVVVDVHARTSDPCWPPGHCKHGFWKATGDHRDHGDHGRGPREGGGAKHDRGGAHIDVDIHIDDHGHGHAHAKGDHHPGKGGKGKGKGKRK